MKRLFLVLALFSTNFIYAQCSFSERYNQISDSKFHKTMYYGWYTISGKTTDDFIKRWDDFSAAYEKDYDLKKPYQGAYAASDYTMEQFKGRLKEYKAAFLPEELLVYYLFSKNDIETYKKRLIEIGTKILSKDDVLAAGLFGGLAGAAIVSSVAQERNDKSGLYAASVVEKEEFERKYIAVEDSKKIRKRALYPYYAASGCQE